MPRTIVECLTPAVPCAECEERDCCRDERRVAQLRASVAELEADLAASKSDHSFEYAACEEQRKRAEAAEQRATRSEGALREILALRTRDNPICHCGGCSQCVARAALAADEEITERILARAEEVERG